eukprot:gene7282-11600_t
MSEAAERFKNYKWNEDENWKIKLSNLYIPDEVDSEKFLKKLQIRYYNENIEKYDPPGNIKHDNSHKSGNNSKKKNEKFFVFTSLCINTYIFILCILTFFSPSLYRNTVITAAINFIVTYIRNNGINSSIFYKLSTDANGQYFMLSFAFIADIDIAFIFILLIMAFFNVVSNLNFVLSSFRFYGKLKEIFAKILETQKNFLMYIAINELMMLVFSIFRLFTVDRSFFKVLVLFNHLKFKFKQSYEIQMIYYTLKQYLDPIFTKPAVPDFIKKIYKKIF